MWLIPVVICAMRHWYRFIIIWVLFSAINSIIAYHAGKSRMNSNTPRFGERLIFFSSSRIVYKWFLFLHKLSYVLGIAGYFVIMGALMGFNLIFGAKLHVWMDTGRSDQTLSIFHPGMLLLFYGLYYGVLGRDFAEVCTDRMASQIGVGELMAQSMYSTTTRTGCRRSRWRRTCARCAATASRATPTTAAPTPRATEWDRRPYTGSPADTCFLPC